MHQKADQVHIGDYFCLSLTMQGYLQTADAKHYLPKCDATGTVSVYLIHINNEQERRKKTALSYFNTDNKRLCFHAIDITSDCLYKNLIAANS